MRTKILVTDHAVHWQEKGKAPRTLLSIVGADSFLRLRDVEERLSPDDAKRIAKWLLKAAERVNHASQAKGRETPASQAIEDEGGDAEDLP